MNEITDGRSTNLAPDIVRAINVLNRGSESISAVMATEESANRFTRALEALQKLSIESSIPLAIVGGLAAIRYGYPAATQDIDIAVGKKELPRLIDAAPKFGVVVALEARSGWHTLTHGDVEINIVPEGGKAKDFAPTTIPSPIEMGVESGLQYASLPSWIELKISSGRQKDRAHIIEVLKMTAEESIDGIGRHLEKVHPKYYAEFKQLLEESNEERRQERDRGKQP